MADCYIYARVSTKDQEKEGYSIPAQLEMLREYAKKKGFRVLEEFAESETGAKRGRSKFSFMTNILQKKGGPRVVLSTKTDRLTRNFYDMVQVDDLIHQQGVEFHLVSAGKILGPDMNRSEKTAWALEVLIAKDFIDNLKESTRDGIDEKVREGGWCWPAPYGYKMIKGEIDIEVDRAPFVRRAFELYASGLYSLKAVINKLYDEGYTYLPSKPKIGTTHLHSILHNRLYIGQIPYKGQVYQGRHRPLIDLDTWLAIQGKAQAGTKNQTAAPLQFLYRDVLTCGTCGSVMSAEMKQGGKYIYYRCWKAANGKCSERYINESIITKHLASVMDRIQFPDDWQQLMLASLETIDQLREVTALEAQTRIDKQIAKQKEVQKKAYWDRAQGIISFDIWQEFHNDCQKEIDRLNAARGRVDKTEGNSRALAMKYFELSGMMSETWKSAPMETKSLLSKMITSKITIHAKKPVIELAAPFDWLFNKRNLIQNEGWYPQGNSNPCLLRERELS